MSIVDGLVHRYKRLKGELGRIESVRTPRRLLTVLDLLGEHVLEATFFGTMAVATWTRYGCASKQHPDLWAAIVCLWQASRATSLVATFGVVYFLSRRSVKQELQIADGVFPPGRAPDKWGSSREPIVIIGSVMFYLALYITLAFLAYDARIVSGVMAVIAVIDFNTRRLIQKHAKQYFGDTGDGGEPEYALRSDERDGDLILERRKTLAQFLFRHPHLGKEAGRIAGCATAFGLAMAGHFYRAEPFTSFAYLVLIGTLIINEWLTQCWRRRRDETWEEINVRAALR